MRSAVAKWTCACVAGILSLLFLGSAIAQSPQTDDRIEALVQRSITLAQSKKLREAESALLAAKEIAEKRYGPDSSASLFVDLAMAEYYLATKQADASLASLRGAKKAIQAILLAGGSAAESEVLDAIRIAGNLFADHHASSEAEELFRLRLELLLRGEPLNVELVSSAHASLASILQDQRRLPDAIASLREALRLAKTLTPPPPTLPVRLANLADALTETGAFNEAEAYFRDAFLVLRHREEAARVQMLPAVLANYAKLMIASGRPHEAEPLLREALKRAVAASPEAARSALSARHALATVLIEIGNHREATRLLWQELKALEADLPPYHAEIINTKTWLASALEAGGSKGEALGLLTDALSHLRSAPVRQPLTLANVRNNLAWVHRRSDELDRAADELKRALAELDNSPNYLDASGSILADLASVALKSGRQGDASRYFEQARDVLLRSQEAGQLTPKALGAADRVAAYFAESGRMDKAAQLSNPHRWQLWLRAHRPVLFVTNRQLVGQQGQRIPSGERSRELSYGRVVMEVTPLASRKLGTRRASGDGILESGGSSLIAGADLRIKEVQYIGRPNGDVDLGFNAAGDLSGDLLIFVHGYNVTFESAAKHAAQIAIDMEYAGHIIAFSWPSSGSLIGYGYDKDSAEIAAGHFADFLQLVLGKEWGGRGKVQIIAHSMGASLVMNALERMALGAATTAGQVTDVVLAHPDIDVDRFAQVLPQARKIARSITVYASSDDRALWLNGLLRQNARLGQAAQGVDGADIIDITGLGSSGLSLNHSVFTNSTVVFNDIVRILRSSTYPPSDRFKHWVERAAGSGRMWKYEPPSVSFEARGP